MKSTLICLAAIAQIALSTVSADTIQKIPLYYKRSSNKKDFITAAAEGLENGMLGGVVQIGNPPQNLTMAFDTSTGFSWVRGSQCVDENCLGRRDYNPENSTTAVSTYHNFMLDYGKGVVNTTIYIDTFRYAGLTVEKMPFGSAYAMKNFNKGFDGYLGLGRDVNLNSSTTFYAKRDIPASGFVPNAFQQSSGTQSAQFGMYTTTTGGGFSESGSVDASNTATSNVASTGSVTPGGWGVFKRNNGGDEPAGYLVLGGIDRDAIKGKLYHMNVVDDQDDSGSWAVRVREAGFQDDPCLSVNKKSKAVLSTSTDVIGLPNKQAEQFRMKWYAEYDKPDNTFKIPCCLMDKLSSFKIQLGDVKVVIPPQYWSYPRRVDSCCEMCQTHIGKSGSDKDYVIGYSFTNAFYTSYDTGKDIISLAMKRNHVNDGLELYDANSKQKN